MDHYEKLYKELVVEFNGKHSYPKLIYLSGNPYESPYYLDLYYMEGILVDQANLKCLGVVFNDYPLYINILIGIICNQKDEEARYKIISGLLKSLHDALGDPDDTAFRDVLIEILSSVLFAWGSKETAVKIMKLSPNPSSSLVDLMNVIKQGTPSISYLDAILRITDVWKTSVVSGIDKSRLLPEAWEFDPVTNAYNVPDIESLNN